MSKRPQISIELIKAIKVKFPEETAMMSNSQAVEWAIKVALGTLVPKKSEESP